MTGIPKNLAFYATPPHACSYLEQQRAVTLFADPTAAISVSLYDQLSKIGFRRSGEHVYLPRCPDCRLCIPARIPVESFRLNRSQQRTMRKNSDLTAAICDETEIDVDEHYALYRRYIQRRHPGGGMDDFEKHQYLQFVDSSWSDTRYVEFRHHGSLVAVAVVDFLETGLSAVYTIYDPDLTQRSLGTFAVLWQAEYCREHGLPWVYLGYWIPQSNKMRYKQHFRPLELYMDGRWRRYHDQLPQLEAPSPLPEHATAC